MKDPTFKAGFEAGVLYGEKREKLIRNALIEIMSAKVKSVTCRVLKTL